MKTFVIVLDVDMETQLVEGAVRGRQDPSKHLKEFAKWWKSPAGKKYAAFDGRGRSRGFNVSKGVAFAHYLAKFKGYERINNFVEVKVKY